MGSSKSKDAAVEEKEDDFKDWLNTTPSWYGGNMSIGKRIDNYKINPLDNGTTLSYRVTNRIPLPRDKVWNIFDNTLDFIKLFNPTSKHLNGDINKIGEIISFNLDFSKYGIKDDTNTMTQELTIKDNKNYVWQISLPIKTGSPLFERYNFTARLYQDNIIPTDDISKEAKEAKEAKAGSDDNNKEEKNNEANGCLLMTDTEFIFNKNVSIESRKLLLKSLRNTCHEYSKKIFDIAFDKCGIHFEGKFITKVPINWCFNFIKDWTKLGWVLSAKPDSCVMFDKDIRVFETLNGQKILERVSVCDDINYIFEYQVLNGPFLMPLRDTITLTKVSDNETKFQSRISIYPRPQQDAEQLKKIYAFVLNTAETKLPDVIAQNYQKSLK